MAEILATAATFWSFTHDLISVPGDRRLVCCWRRDPRSGQLTRSWKPVAVRPLF